MRKRWWFWGLALVLLWGAALGQELELEEKVREHQLPNGMQILTYERHQAPVVSITMRLKVGAVDEVTGYTGTAHLLEHMLFKGTAIIGTRDYAAEKPLLEEIDRLGEELDAERAKGDKADKDKIRRLEEQLRQKQQEHQKYVIKNELDQIYSAAGGVGFNASTSKDFTTYTVSLPANKLELWMVLESDRMRNPVLREFYSEREVVLEERRQRTDTRPFGKLYETFLATAFLAHPYGVPIIGWASDIALLPKAKVKEFLHRYYAPNNAVVAFVGDFQPEQVIAWMEKYFGPIPPQNIPRRTVTREPPQMGERRVAVEFDAEPQLLIGYHKPTAPHRDDYVLDVVDAILSTGRTSRFYRRLIEEQQIAVSAWTSNGSPGARYDNLFVIGATPRHPHTTEELEQAIYAEMERLQSEPVPDWELEKVRHQVRAAFIRSLNSNRGLADQLSYFQALLGDWRYLTTYPEVIETVTPEEIQAAVNRYFIPANRTVAVLVRKTKVGGKG
ncbi:MAG TPA: insulinase family protein [Armatimonadetes bacterium]|nr:insulinase family protein [Armatimonadota bacterium]